MDGSIEYLSICKRTCLNKWARRRNGRRLKWLNKIEDGYEHEFVKKQWCMKQGVEMLVEMGLMPMSKWSLGCSRLQR